MGGWIKLYRDIQEHWIWKSDNRFKWWVDILLTVNHSDTKVLIKGKLIECKRGQSVMSLETWGKRWNVSKKTVKDFFELLQKDSMLVYESIQISTRITVCNYDNYQNEVNGKEMKGKRKVNAKETDTLPKQEGIKNDKEVYTDFYDSELSKTTDENYHNFVKWMFGQNEINEPFKKCLSLKHQIGYNQYLNLRKIAKENGTLLMDKIRTLENKFDKYKPTSLNLTLITWLKMSFKK